MKKNVGRTERIVRMSGGMAGILLFPQMTGYAQWIPLGLGVYFFITGVINR